MPRPIRIFLSYDSRDREHCDTLETHLAALKRQGAIEVWHDRLLEPGASREKEIRRSLGEADLILLLLSPDFLASNDRFDVEVRRAMEQHAAATSRVIPVIVRPVDWRGFTFSRLAATPRDGLPVTCWANQDEAWLNVTQSIREVVADLVARDEAVKVRIAVVDGPEKGRSFTFADRDRVVVGRAPDATFCVNDPQLSRRQFLIEWNPPHVLLRDLDSSSGTFLNGESERLRTAPLRSGDLLRAGATTFLIEVIHPAPQVPKEPPPDEQPTVLPTVTVDASGQAKATAPVRCFRCGQKAPGEEPRLRSARVAYFCDECRGVLLSEPVLPPGYQLLRELGRGTMGAVYLARHQLLGIERALKLILPVAAMTERARRSFVREASEQARLRHPRIVEVHEFLEVKPGLFCIVMEHVKGESAEALLKRNADRHLDPRTAAVIVGQALEGLEHAHSHGVVHRDIKDANILVEGRGLNVNVKLADFGLAKAYETSGASGFTRTGETAGTIHYMAPEQLLDFRGVGPAADLYSMGVVLYRLLTGAFPLDIPPGDNPLTILLDKPIVPVRLREPATPASLADAVERALMKSPDRRFESAEVMRRAILSAMT